MKSFFRRGILAGVLFAFAAAHADETCTNKEGTPSYKSRTVVGNSVYIKQPFLVTADGPLRFSTESYGICTFFGYSNLAYNISTALRNSDAEVLATINSNGNLTAIGPTFRGLVIDSVVCSPTH